MPPHRVYIEPFLGGAAILRRKRPAALNIGIDRDPEVIDAAARARIAGTGEAVRVTLARTDEARNLNASTCSTCSPTCSGNGRSSAIGAASGRLGQTCNIPYPTSQEAEAALDRQRRRKERRGCAAPGAGRNR